MKFYLFGIQKNNISTYETKYVRQFLCLSGVSYTTKKNPTKVYIGNKLLITFTQEYSLS